MTKLSIKRPVTTIMLVLVVFLTGILAYSTLELAYMPATDIPVAVVSTSYTGTGPEEMEELITKPIEEVVGTLTGVDTISSISSVGSSTVIIQYVDGTDLDNAAIDLREKIDMIKGMLPEESKEPLVLKIDINAETISVGITGENLSINDFYDNYEKEISSALERIDGISSVDILGGEEKEVQITVDQTNMDRYGITVGSIRQMLYAENLNLPSGTINYGDSDLQLRALGQFNSLDDIRNLLIPTRSGSHIYLKDIANVEIARKDKTSLSLINGEPGIIYSLSKNSDANIVTVSDNVVEALEDLSKNYSTMDFKMLTNSADFIKLSINNIVETAFLSSLVAIIVLLIFLGDPKSSLIIGVSIPTSIFATFSMMYFSNMSMNIISMGGIVIGIGMLVDNSVVVLENINVYLDRGFSPKEAALQGTGEVSMAIFASTLTTVACFAPLLFVSGFIGQMLSNLSLTICFALISSLIVSLTFVPMACSKILKKRDVNNEKQGPKLLFGILDKIDSGYGKILKFSLNHKLGVIVGVIAFFILSLQVIPLAGTDLVPETDEGVINVSVSMPDGTKYEILESKVLEVVDTIGNVPEASLTYVEIGGSSFGASQPASININLVDKEERKISTEEVINRIKGQIKNIVGAEIDVKATSSMGGSALGGGDLSLNIYGYDLDELRQVSNDVVNLIKEIPGAEKVESSLDEAIPEGNIILDREKASRYGLTTNDIASTIDTAISGITSSTYKIDGTEVDIRIKYDNDKINFLSDLNNLTITTAMGTSIPITEVAEIVVDESAVAINRENQQRISQISGDFDNSIDSGTVQKLVEEKLATYNFPQQTRYAFGGSLDMLTDSFQNLILALLISVVLIYMIMASQFESFLYPFIIMFSVPIALVGGILGIYFTGNTISVLVLMGLIMLVGIVVNNAIVLVDYTNQIIERENISAYEALIKAGPSRLRPILMTTLTTIIGLVPMAVTNSSGMEMQQPLAITIISGLTLSTLVTLVFIPVLYMIFDSFRKKLRKNENQEMVSEMRE